jgi:hypothetical protein
MFHPAELDSLTVDFKITRAGSITRVLNGSGRRIIPSRSVKNFDFGYEGTIRSSEMIAGPNNYFD